MKSVFNEADPSLSAGPPDGDGRRGDGHTERYGLIYVDYRDQKRTIKDSGLWYARVSPSNRLNP